MKRSNKDSEFNGISQFLPYQTSLLYTNREKWWNIMQICGIFNFIEFRKRYIGDISHDIIKTEKKIYRVGLNRQWKNTHKRKSHLIKIIMSDETVNMH